MPGGGRPPGSPNKATADARRAIAAFVDNNAERLQAWLDDVANGIPARDADGNQVFDNNGKPVYLTAPNPEKAFTLFQSVVEYHVPKLQRTEVLADIKEEVQHSGSVMVISDLLKKLKDV